MFSSSLSDMIDTEFENFITNCKCVNSVLFHAPYAIRKNRWVLIKHNLNDIISRVTRDILLWPIQCQ